MTSMSNSMMEEFFRWDKDRSTEFSPGSYAVVIELIRNFHQEETSGYTRDCWFQIYKPVVDL